MTKPTDFRFRYSSLIVYLSSWLFHSQPIKQWWEKLSPKVKGYKILLLRNWRFSGKLFTLLYAIHVNSNCYFSVSLHVWYNSKPDTRKSESKTFYITYQLNNIQQVFLSLICLVMDRRKIFSLTNHKVFERMKLENIC